MSGGLGGGFRNRDSGWEAHVVKSFRLSSSKVAMKGRIRWLLRWREFEREWFELEVKGGLGFWEERSGWKEFDSAGGLHEKLFEDARPDEQARSNYVMLEKVRQRATWEEKRIHHLHFRC